MSYVIRMQAGSKTKASLSLYGPLDYWERTGERFISELKALGVLEEIDVHINSEGGVLADAIAIYNLLKSNPAKIIVTIDAIALSAASVVAMAGDEIRMPANSIMMIHNPWSSTEGDAAAMLRAAAMLENFANAATQIYAERTGLQADEIRNMMTNETWFTAEQAVEFGFATEVIESHKIAAHFDETKFKNAPPALMKLKGEPQMATEPNPAAPTPAPAAPAVVAAAPAPAYDTMAVLNAVSAANLPAFVAAALIERQANAATVAARVTEAADIVKACADAGVPKAADGLLRTGATLAAARDILASLRASAEEAAGNTDPSNGGTHAGSGAVKDMDSKAIQAGFAKSLARYSGGKRSA